jgi:hypothetical protein
MGRLLDFVNNREIDARVTWNLLGCLAVEVSVLSVHLHASDGFNLCYYISSDNGNWKRHISFPAFLNKKAVSGF